MSSQRPRDHAAKSRKSTDDSRRHWIPASKVGLSLKISAKALKDFERIQEETIKAAEKDQKFSWR